MLILLSKFWLNIIDFLKVKLIILGSFWLIRIAKKHDIHSITGSSHFTGSDATSKTKSKKKGVLFWI